MLRLLLLGSLLIVVPSSRSLADESMALSAADRATIIQKAIEIMLKRDGPKVFSQYSVISTENMSAELLPRIEGSEFKLMKPREIEKRKKRAGHFRYLLISQITANPSFASLSIGIIEWANGLPLYAHSYKYVFENVGGQWQGRIHLIIC